MPVDPPGKSPSIGSIFGGVRESSDTRLFAATCQEIHASAAAAPSAHTVAVFRVQTAFRSCFSPSLFLTIPTCALSCRSLKEKDRPSSSLAVGLVAAGQDLG